MGQAGLSYLSGQIIGMRRNRRYFFVGVFLLGGLFAQAQSAVPAAPVTSTTSVAPATSPRPAYFIDGYHGGIYGHIPSWQTRFMVDKLHEYPDWKINLELEPESWDTIAVRDPRAYKDFKEMVASSPDRIEYINPAYGQSYLYNISGESVIRQFYYGMRKLRQHFPGMTFTSYSSEEPCFTSALPSILSSFGFRYASLKNPNTCWGGYARAHGGEFVDWVGPDGTKLLTVPRYAIEALKPHSTWETIGNSNSVEYITKAFAAGIGEPVGMCLQDAGWDRGPWIKKGEGYRPTIFETWRGYIEKRTDMRPRADWRFSQEDVLTSLVWGGQVLQRVAQRVRKAENGIVAAEKLASMAAVYKGVPWPGASFDAAWRTLLLSQHHDCWIVPYNRVRETNYTWAEWVERWTANTDDRCDSIIGPAMLAWAGKDHGASIVTVFNTTAVERGDVAEFMPPTGWEDVEVVDARGRVMVGQVVDGGRILFRAHVPALGYASYTLRRGAASEAHGAVSPMARGAHAVLRGDSVCVIETDLYKLVIDVAHGGRILRLATKDGKEFVDGAGMRSFGELRGNFYREGGFRSSTEAPVKVGVVENGPLRVRVKMEGRIAGEPFMQTITMLQGEPRIDFHLEINWTGDHRIGESPDSMKGDPLRKEFYNDSFKLQVLFPPALTKQRVYKNAPFDVLESRLDHTFFNSWDSIRNVVLLNWVDVTDGDGKYGLALFCNHTTSYSHGAGYPLGLTIQYSGPGLFGQGYAISGPTVVNYALFPHSGNWDKAGVWTEETKWNEPLMSMEGMGGVEAGRSLLRPAKPGWEVSSVTVDGKDLIVRLFHAEGKDSIQRILPGFSFGKAILIGLDGREVRGLGLAGKEVVVAAPQFGIRTIKFTNVLK